MQISNGTMAEFITDDDKKQEVPKIYNSDNISYYSLNQLQSDTKIPQTPKKPVAVSMPVSITS